MKTLLASWQTWALLSAGFAALTAVLAKVGVEDVNSNYATFVRTVVVLLFLALVLVATDGFEPFNAMTRRSQVFLILSGLATGLSWLCYFRALKLGTVSQVAPVDKLSLLLAVILGVLFLRERLALVQWAGVVLMGIGVVMVAMKR